MEFLQSNSSTNFRFTSIQITIEKHVTIKNQTDLFCFPFSFLQSPASFGKGAPHLYADMTPMAGPCAITAVNVVVSLGRRLAKGGARAKGPGDRTAGRQRVAGVETGGEHERAEDAPGAACRGCEPGRRPDTGRARRADQAPWGRREALFVRPLRAFAHVQDTR